MYVEFRGKTWSKCKPYREHGRQQRKNKTFLRLRELTCYHMSPKKQHQKGVIQKHYGRGGLKKWLKLWICPHQKGVQQVIQAIAQVRTLERGFKLTQKAHPHSPLDTPLEQHHPTQIVCWYNFYWVQNTPLLLLFFYTHPFPGHFSATTVSMKLFTSCCQTGHVNILQKLLC